MSNTEQVLEAALHKAAAVQPLTTHHENLEKLDEPDMQDTAGEVGTNSQVMYSCGPLHINEQRQDDLREPTYNSSVPIQDVALKTCWKQWTIERGGRKGSGISVQLVQHDDYRITKLDF